MGFAEDLRNRTKKFAVDAIKLYRLLPKNEESRIVGRQFLRSATSVASNYRATTRGRSDKEFFSKLSITVEESDESLFWLEIMEESKMLAGEELNKMKQEANELTAILAKSRQTMRNRMNNKT